MAAPAKAGKFTLYGAGRQGFAAERASTTPIPRQSINPVARGLAPVGLQSSPKISRPPHNLWRGSLLPLDCEAVAKPNHSVQLTKRDCRLWGCYAAQREQAPSPQRPLDVIPKAAPATAALPHPAHHTHHAMKWHRARQSH
ncbi:hypothetical protein FFH90_003310 [Pseudomonas sp. ATCC 43928]|nr:hypothetical protein FFH90_003310 [Pseudomonas sp. ATCC 43928]